MNKWVVPPSLNFYAIDLISGTCFLCLSKHSINEKKAVVCGIGEFINASQFK